MRNMGGLSRRITTSVAVACAVGAVTLFSFPTRAFAAGGNEAAAEALFEAGKKLASQGKYAEACPKFAESNRLDRGAGTLIHLGDCYEKNKQTASAWATYKEASSAAQALGRKDWEKLAAQRATALEPKLAHLTIKVVDPAPKLEVTRDGASVEAASLNLPIPVDVGAHAIEAAAPGFKSFKTSAPVAKDGDAVEVTIPKLEADAAAPLTTPTPTSTPTTNPTPTTPSHSDGSGQRTIGLVVGGVGVAGLAVGAITGLMAMGKSSDAKKSCANDGPCADKSAVDAASSAKTLGLVSTISFIAGGTLAAAGAALFFTAPGGSEKKTGNNGTKNVHNTSIRIAPSAGPGAGGITVLGVF